MRLHSIQFSGYRRFLKETTLKLSSKMTVLIGPNEAGKSSTLKMIHNLSHSEPYSDADRYEYAQGVKIALKARFSLDKRDYDTIGNDTPAFLVVYKNDDGQRTFDLEPPIDRPKSHRVDFKRELEGFVTGEQSIGLLTATKEDVAEIRKVIRSLSIESNDIPKVQLSNISRISEKFFSKSNDEQVERIREAIREFVELESSRSPTEIAAEALSEQLPDILEFTPEDREIVSPFNMGFFRHEKRDQSKEPCNTLANLCEISGLDIAKLKQNLVTNKPAKIASQFDNANRKLEEIFQSAWSQSDIFIQLYWDKPNVHIMVKVLGEEEGQYEFSKIEARSDGFRQYVALLAFIIKNNSQCPILLIDEAELHLHYDAQADFVQTFTERNLISQVVYTTHSAGCLPEDLGMGVKLIRGDETNGKIETSQIENNFWTTDTTGFNPLLFGMGAQTMAFFPTRRALVTEGQSDFILAPTIFRHAAGVDFNGFQVVPGFASASKDEAPLFSLQGTKVSYLFDNDAAGKGYRSAVRKMGIEDRRIFHVNGSDADRVITIEDWVSDSTFQQAVEVYRKRFFPNKEAIADGYFAGDGKIRKLEALEKEIGVNISKTMLAYIILEVAENCNGSDIVNPRHKEMIRKLRSDILNSFASGS